MVISAEASLAFIIFSFLIWAGAALALEDTLSSGELTLLGSHSISGKFHPYAGLAILLLILRGCLVQTSGDPYLAIAPILFGLLLGIMLAPLNRLFQFHESLQALALCPLLIWLPGLIPNTPLSVASAGITTLLLNMFGVPAIHEGSIVDLGIAAVKVAGPCAGADLITQSLVVGLLALVLVPLPQQQLRLPFLLLAPICGWIANLLRIALLVLLAASDPAAASSDTGFFGFFHLGNGGLLFSGLGIAAYGLVYGQWLQRGLRQHSL